MSQQSATRRWTTSQLITARNSSDTSLFVVDSSESRDVLFESDVSYRKCCCCFGRLFRRVETISIMPSIEDRIMNQIKLKGKKGVAFTLRHEGRKGSWTQNLPRVLALQPHWNYSWAIQRLDEYLQPPSIQFIPMLRGYNKNKIDDALSRIRVQDPELLLSFNEPDSKNQSNISVERALEAWPKLESLNIPLVSPSCVNSQGPWMQQFMSGVKCRRLRVDAIGFHDYGGGNAANFQKKLRTIHEKYKMPVLVTEFAVADWKAKTPAENRHKPELVLAFMQEMLPWLEAQEWIIGYAWFSFDKRSPVGTSSALFENNAELTRLGEFYSSFKPNISPDTSLP